MSSSTPISGTTVKLIAYVDELEGGPPQVSLTILAKPKWRMHRVQMALVQQYERYLADYPAFSQAYTISNWKAFPPKPEFDETDRVNDILEKPKGFLGPHIHIYATIKAVGDGKQARITPKTSEKSLIMDGNNNSRKHILNDSAVIALRKKSLEHKDNTGRPSAGTLKRPTKTPPQGAFSGSRRDAPRKDLYDIGDGSEVETTHDEDLRYGGPNPKRARTDAWPRRRPQTTPLIPHHIPRAAPASAQLQSPNVQSTPALASNVSLSQSIIPVNPDYSVKARGLWTERENGLMLAEIIKNGAATPTATLRNTLFPGRTTEGIRKRRKKMQNEQAKEILRRRLTPGLVMTKTPLSSKPPTSSKTPSRCSKISTPRLPISRRRQESSPCVLIDVVDDPSQQKLEIRPGGAVRMKSKGDDGYMTPNSSPPLPSKAISGTSTGTGSPEGEMPGNNSFDDTPAEEGQPQELVSLSPQGEFPIAAPKSYSKFLQDARAAAASDEHAAESQLHPYHLNNNFEPEDEIVSSNPEGSTSPSPNLAPDHSSERGPSPRVAIQKKLRRSDVAVSKVLLSSCPEKIRSPSPSTAAAWIDCEKSSKMVRSSPPWPEDTSIAMSAVADAEAREAAHKSSKAKSTATNSLDPKLGREERSRVDRYQSIESVKVEGLEFRKPGQTPRTLNFKARTPRSLSRSIVRRRSASGKSNMASGESEPDSSDGENSDSSDDESDAAMDVDIEVNGTTKAELVVDVDSDSESESSSDDDTSDYPGLKSEGAVANVAVEVNGNTKVEMEFEAASNGNVSSVPSHEDDLNSSSSDDSSEDEDEQGINGDVANDLADQQRQLDNGGRGIENEDIDGSVADYLADQQLRSDAGLIDAEEVRSNEKTIGNAQPVRGPRKSSIANDSTASEGEQESDDVVAANNFPQHEETRVKKSREERAEASSEDSEAEEDDDEEEDEALAPSIFAPRTELHTEPSISAPRKLMAVVISRKRSLEETNTILQAIDAESEVQEAREDAYASFEKQLKLMSDSLAREMAKLFT